MCNGREHYGKRLRCRTLDVNTTSWTKGTTSDLDITGQIDRPSLLREHFEKCFLHRRRYTAGDDTRQIRLGRLKYLQLCHGPVGCQYKLDERPTRAAYVNIGTP